MLNGRIKLLFFIFLFTLFTLLATSETYTSGRGFSQETKLGCGGTFDFFIVDDVIWYVGKRYSALIKKNGEVINGPSGWKAHNEYGWEYEAASIYRNPSDGEMYLLTRTAHIIHLYKKSEEVEVKANLRRFSPYLPSIAIDEEGRYYLSDVDNGRIIVLSPEFEYIKKISSKGRDDKHLQTPLGIEVRNGKIYIADSSAHAVKVFSTEDGSFVRKIGGESGDERLITPVDVGVDGNGNVYVLDRYVNKVKKFSSSGSYILSVNVLEKPLKIFVEKNGNFWVMSFFKTREYVKQ